MIYLCDNKRHLICIPYSMENLHKMAKDLGIKKCWFHKNHYDIPKKKVEGIQKRCIFVSTRDIIKVIASEAHMDEYLTLNQGVDEFESLPEHMELKEQAQRLFETYSFLALKTCKYGIQDLSEDEQKALDMAIDLHREDLRKKLDGQIN